MEDMLFSKKANFSGIIDSTGTITLQPVNGYLVPFRKGYFFHYTGKIIIEKSD